MATSVGFQLEAGRIPGERIATEEVTSDSSTFTTTETEIASVEASVVNGRTYKVVFHGAFENTVDGVIRVSLYQDTLGGTRLTLRDIGIETAGTAQVIHVEAEYTASATEDKTFVVGGDVTNGGGTANLNAAPSFPTYLYVDYIRG